MIFGIVQLTLAVFIDIEALEIISSQNAHVPKYLTARTPDADVVCGESSVGHMKSRVRNYDSFKAICTRKACARTRNVAVFYHCIF